MATRGFPKWLLDGKEKVTHSKEWGEFVEELYDAVQQQLKESHVHAFTDLTPPERQLFMERAAKAIHGGRPYGDLYDKVSESLDKHMNNEVSRQLLEDFPVDTKTDLILDQAQEGAVSLLKKWPDMKSKLHVFFNQPLPKGLRQIAWKLFLDNTKIRKRYVDLLTQNPRSAISHLDFEISQKCEQLLISEPTFIDLKGSVGAFYGMKAVLSYHHASQKTDLGLPDIDFLLTVPFVQVASNRISRREPAANNVVALLVEEYLTFLHSRPGYMVDSGSQAHDDEMKAFCLRIAHHLHQRDPGTAAAISAAYVPSREPTPEPDLENLGHPGSKPGTSSGAKSAASAPSSQSKPKTPSSGQQDDEKPVTPSSDKPQNSGGDKPKTPSGDKPKTPSGDKPKTPSGDKPKTPSGDKPKTPSGDKPKTPSGEEPEPSSGSKPGTSSGKKPKKSKNKPSQDRNTNNSNNEQDNIVSTETGSQAILSDALIPLVRPLIRSMFVGYVQMDVLLFIWDQYMIGLDAPGFHDAYLPAVTACFFMLLKEKVTKCTTMAALEAALRDGGVELRIPQFQYEIKKHFANDLTRILNQDDRAALPVLDPTQANYRPWVYWFRDNIPSRMTPGERHRAREERDADRERTKQQDIDEERRRREEDERMRREEEERFYEQQEADRRRQEEDRMYLEQQLEEERRRRVENELNAQAEIERLQQEIDDLHRMKMKSPDVLSLNSTISRFLIPPPPTAASLNYAMTPITEQKLKIKTPPPTAPVKQQADDVLTALLTRTSDAFVKIGHSNEVEKLQLDDYTRECILRHKDDVKAAEMEVFGHTLAPMEFEKMSTQEQKRSSDQIMDVIKRKLQERRLKDLSALGRASAARI